MDDELIQFKEVTKKFGKNTVLNSINLTIPEGKITGIIGASGEGKSTILKMIASFYKPTKGKIFYFRREIHNDIKNIKKSFGLAIDDGSFYEKLTVEENLFHFGTLYLVPKKILKKRIEDITSFVGLKNAKNILAENLSLGMKKRLDIACALIHRPSVLILDEPTADLDPLLRRQIIHLIKKINSKGTTIVLTTQLLEEADKICDKIAILYNEKIIEEGEPGKIKSKYHAYTLNDLFNKIFSKKDRKTYQESTKEKTKLTLVENNKEIENDKKEIKEEIKQENKEEKINGN